MLIENCVNLINFTFSRQLSSLNDFYKKKQKQATEVSTSLLVRSTDIKYLHVHVFKIIHSLTNMYIVYHVLIIISKGISVSF